MSAQTFNVATEFVGKIVGAKGKTIRRLRYTFHSDIKISGEGVVEIANGEAEAMKKAKEYILSMCSDEKPERLPRPVSTGDRKKPERKPAAEKKPAAGDKKAADGKKGDGKKAADGKKGDGKKAADGKKGDAKKGAAAAAAKGEEGTATKKRAGRSRSRKATRSKLEETIKEAADAVTVTTKFPAELVRSALVLRGRGFNQARRAEQQSKSLIEFDAAALKPLDADGKPLKYADAAPLIKKLGHVAVTIRSLTKEGAEKCKADLQAIIDDTVKAEKEREERKVVAEKARQEAAERRAKLKSVTIPTTVIPRALIRDRAEFDKQFEGAEVVFSRNKESGEASATVYAPTDAIAKAAAAELQKRQAEIIAKREEKKAAAAATKA